VQTNNRVQKAVTTGVLSAVVLVLMLLNLDFIILPGISLTTLHIPVIIGAILDGPLVGLLIGLLFGAASLVKSLMMAASPMDIAFQLYPFIAIVPRLCIGPAAWLVYRLIAGRPVDAWTPVAVVREMTAIVAGSLIGSLVNTALVLGGLVLFAENIAPAMSVRFGLALLALPNALIEAAAAGLVTLAVVSAWKRLPIRGGRSKLSAER